jgi:UDP:flavonoid glycosyltransferase YjiC (YdhE family)
MKILFASTPATGHINPLLAIVRMLRAEGHEITFLTGSAFRTRIEKQRSEIRFASGPRRFRRARPSLGGSRTQGHSAGARMVPSCH